MSGVWSRKMFNVTCIADFPDHNAEVRLLQRMDEPRRRKMVRYTLDTHCKDIGL
jgi:hypothetical protein